MKKQRKKKEKKRKAETAMPKLTCSSKRAWREKEEKKNISAGHLRRNLTQKNNLKVFKKKWKIEHLRPKRSRSTERKLKE